MILGEGGAEEVGKGVSLVEKAAKAGNRYAVAHIAEIKKLAEKWPKTGICKLGAN